MFKTTYELDDKSTRVLIGARIKDKALDWMYSKPEFLEMSIEQLVEMKNTFRYKVSKMVLRKEFKERIWKRGDLFSEYLHAKVILANKVPVEEEEIIDYIVEGIPDPILRDQARIQRLNSKASLLEAFEKVMLRPKSSLHVGLRKRNDDPAAKANNDDASRPEE